MRRLRQLSMAVVLTFMLGTCSLAGTIECPPAPPPEPPSATATGIVETPPNATSDAFVDVAMNLLQSALSLF